MRAMNGQGDSARPHVALRGQIVICRPKTPCWSGTCGTFILSCCANSQAAVLLNCGRYSGTAASHFFKVAEGTVEEQWATYSYITCSQQIYYSYSTDIPTTVLVGSGRY